MSEKDYQNYPKSLSPGAEEKIKSHIVQILNQCIYPICEFSANKLEKN